MVQAAAGRALAAMQVTGADYAAAYMPASVGQCPFVLVCDRRGAVACALPPDMNDTFIANQILDLLRRRLFGLQLTDSCITFRPGHDRPLLVVSEAAKSRGNTVRFSLRRRTPPTRDADHTADFEPMLDFDRPVAPPKFAAPAQEVEAAAPESAGLSAAELPELSEEALELLHAVRLSAIAAASIIERIFFIVCYLSE